MHSADIIGLVGVLFVIIAYFFLQVEKIKSDGIFYSLFNAVGAAMILYSLFFKWNLSAFVMEGTWFLLSLYGVIKSLRSNKKKNIE